MKKFCFQSGGGLVLLTVLKVIVVISVWICLASGVALADYHSTGDGSAGSPFQISTDDDWRVLTITPGDWDKCFILMNDLDLTGISITPVGIFEVAPFIGTFDGNNHVISNAAINQPLLDHIGLFGVVGTGAQIREVVLMNFAFTGSNYVGGLCGVNSGTIDACYASGVVTGNVYVGGLCGFNDNTISASSATGSVTGFDTIGGLCGWNEGTISISKSTGAVTGNTAVGGLCGYNQLGLNGGLGIISNSYATGTVTGFSSVGGLCGRNYWMGIISTSYSTAAVSGTDPSSIIGGFVGVNDLGFVDGFWDMENSGMTDGVGNEDPDPVGVFGKTTIGMKTLSTFTSVGWDFVGESVNGTDDFWKMGDDGVDYPRLAWEQGDTQAPIVRAIIPASIPAGMSFSLQGVADDSGTGESTITGAWYSIDSGTTWIPMTAVDSEYPYTKTIEAFLSGGLPVGVYLVQLKAEDEAGNIGYSEPWLLAMYDRSAGYGVGVGWINSPAGALYPGNPDYAGVVGQVIFGFIAKYYRGVPVPMGETLFQFTAGNLRFVSTAYQWLVVAGSRAQFKGDGMLNGAPGYGFMLTAIDGALLGNHRPDRFRIKIWNKGTGEIVYDNQAGSNDIAVPDTDGTRVQGGNIVILRCN